jgi:hypothetical protein
MRVRLALLLIVLPTFAFAGIVLTRTPGTWQLKTRSGTTVSSGHLTRDACEASITQPGEYRECTPTGTITAVGVCDPSPQPPPVVVDGFTLRGDYAPVTEGCPAEHMAFTQTQAVRDPYPSCAWVERPVRVTDCDGKQVAPIIGEAGEDTAQVIEPGPWVEELDYPLGTPCPAEAGGNCISQRPPA